MTGLIPLDKAEGILSRRASGAAARQYQERKHGHAGTLDPLASGVLPVLLGRATRLIPFLDDEKRYEATLRFGLRTDTADITGETIAETSARPSRAGFEAALPAFTGDIMQTPPLYSALKKDGRPLYEYARRGQSVEIAARHAHIGALTLTSFDGETASLSVSCRTGTYIRTLIEDIAQSAGTLATMTALRRTRACGVDIAQCAKIDEIEAGARPLIGAQELFSHLPQTHAPENGLKYFLNGGDIAIGRFDTGFTGLCRVYSVREEFLGLCESDGETVKLVWAQEIYSSEENDAEV